MIHVAILTISDSVSAGSKEDLSGLKLHERITELGWSIVEAAILPDERDQISTLLRHWADSGEISVIVTTGGTGAALRDVTPEATRDILDRELPGIGEQMRHESRAFTPMAALSRSLGGTRGACFIVNLPGSPKGAIQSFDAIAKLIPHIVDLIQGKTKHDVDMPN